MSSKIIEERISNGWLGFLDYFVSKTKYSNYSAFHFLFFFRITLPVDNDCHLYRNKPCFCLKSESYKYLNNTCVVYSLTFADANSERKKNNKNVNRFDVTFWNTTDLFIFVFIKYIRDAQRRISTHRVKNELINIPIII